jgi:DNA-binding transcriptional MocR family regulator
VSRPSGGYFLWAQLPAGVDTLVLHRQALAQGISTAPGALFSADQRFRSALRLNGGYPHDERVLAAVKVLGRLAGRR